MQINTEKNLFLKILGTKKRKSYGKRSKLAIGQECIMKFGTLYSLYIKSLYI